MWFVIALRDIETGSTTISRGTMLRVTSVYRNEVINAKAVDMRSMSGEPVGLLHNRPDQWLLDLGFSPDMFL